MLAHAERMSSNKPTLPLPANMNLNLAGMPDCCLKAGCPQVDSSHLPWLCHSLTLKGQDAGIFAGLFSNFRFGPDTAPSKIKKRMIFRNPGFEKPKFGLFPIFRVGTDTGQIKNKKTLRNPGAERTKCWPFFLIFVLAPTRCLGQDSSHPLGLEWGRLMSPPWAWTGEGTGLRVPFWGSKKPVKLEPVIEDLSYLS